MYAPDPDEKFDFQNMDVKLYLALKALIVLAKEEAQSLVYLGREDDATQEAANNAKHLVEQAMLALAEFELAAGPLPEWAIGRNWTYELQPGAQLMTKDGRVMGNAHVIRVKEGGIIRDGNPDLLYDCITDAGSKFVFTEQELNTCFTIGDWISDPARIIKDFDRNGEFDMENPL